MVVTLEQCPAFYPADSAGQQNSASNFHTPFLAGSPGQAPSSTNPPGRRLIKLRLGLRRSFQEIRQSIVSNPHPEIKQET